MEDIFELNPKISSAICVIIGFILSDDLTANEQNVIGNWLLLIGQVLITNAASQALIERRTQGPVTNINSKNFKKKYNPLFFDVNKAKAILQEEQISHENIDLIIKKINQIEKVLTDLIAN